MTCVFALVGHYLSGGHDIVALLGDVEMFDNCYAFSKCIFIQKW